jgi:S1-C subfamily serine protease
VPPAAVAVPTAVLQGAIASTVKIESQGCGVTREGSGFTVAPQVVVTNAHVVAGATRVDAFEPDGARRSASIVTFDDNRDLAVLSVAGLDEPPMAIAEPSVGTDGAVLGHPEGQDAVRAAPAAVREQILAVGRDIYGDDVTTRDVLVLAASLAPGDSGAPMIDPAGRVVGVAFAVAPDRPATAYALSDAELRAVLDAPRVSGAGGACM